MAIACRHSAEIQPLMDIPISDLMEMQGRHQQDKQNVKKKIDKVGSRVYWH